MSRKTDKKLIDPAVSQYLSDIGKIGGRIGGKKSKGGGRPRIPDDQMTEAQKKRRARYEASKRKERLG